MKQANQAPHYAFSDKYTPDHARNYYEKHHDNIWRRLSNWRETAMLRKALVMAGQPKSVLDLPCGTGRFWPLLAEQPERTIYAADNSQAMIDVGLQSRPPAVTARIAKTFQCSAFATGLPDNFVDCLISIRLLHHIDQGEDRVRMLKEFARVSADTVIVTLWVDGNYKAWRRKRLERKRAKQAEKTPQNRFLVGKKQIEQEFTAAGLEIVGHVDFLKYWDKWRTYVLRVRRAA
jgi:SAM-dependent methyltransferase